MALDRTYRISSENGPSPDLRPPSPIPMGAMVSRYQLRRCWEFGLAYDSQAVLRPVFRTFLVKFAGDRECRAKLREHLRRFDFRCWIIVSPPIMCICGLTRLCARYA